MITVINLKYGMIMINFGSLHVLMICFICRIFRLAPSQIHYHPFSPGGQRKNFGNLLINQTDGSWLDNCWPWNHCDDQTDELKNLKGTISDQRGKTIYREKMMLVDSCQGVRHLRFLGEVTKNRAILGMHFCMSGNTCRAGMVRNTSGIVPRRTSDT